jgi:hypothetical protein
MPEQTFKSPNFYEREIDLSAPRPEGPSGVPAGVIGTSQKGPAFVPTTVGNFDEFISKFGNLDPKCFGTYAVNEFLKHKTSLTYLRVLGGGANDTEAEIETTRATGRVEGAGMYLDGVVAPHDDLGRHNGVVQFLVATHNATGDELVGLPLFSNNDSISSANSARLVRGVFMTPETARIMIAADPTVPNAFDGTDSDQTNIAAGVFNGKFKLIVSSTLGNSFANTDGSAGVKIFTASLNPTDADYFAKVMNTDPDKFVQEQHFVYAHFPVDAELAIADGPAAILSGSNNTSADSGDPTLQFRKAFGAYDTRFRAPASPWFISQPFGSTEYDLFKFEALDDGEHANTLYKIAITDLKLSMDDSDRFATFTVQIRDWHDTDVNPLVLESYPNCTLNPKSRNYIAKLIGDLKTRFDFDAEIPEERRLVTTGNYNNVSKLVRIVMHENVDRGLIPENTVPFGFRGLGLPKTNDLLTDASPVTPRLTGNISTAALRGAILPPLPFRFKVTKGEVLSTGTWPGEPGKTEVPFSPYHWGVKFERNTAPLNSNVISEKNDLLANYTKFLGISKLDTLVTGSGADELNNNKFTLAKVALSNLAATNVSAVITGSVGQHMREAAYLRDGAINPSDYTIDDGVIGNRLTLASLLNKLTASEFNKFSPYTKFVTFMHGGWDGVNILDRDARRLNDKACSFDVGAGSQIGGAEPTFVSPGFSVSSTNFGGVGQNNSTVFSYKTAVDIMTDPLLVNTNILAIPGIREPFLTDYTMNKVRDYGLAYFVMDIPAYNDAGERLFDDSADRPNVNQTTNMFDSRVIDNNYAGAYFPDVFIDDATNRRRVKVPASIAAYGALAFNDRVAYPWFAPAGFNRAALDFVNNVGVRLSVNDRDRLYESRVNPIATFPRLGFVIYGQKTLQINKSALDRVNVRRLLLEVKRVIINIARNLVFEQNTPDVRNRFVADATLQLGLIQSQAGVEAFQVVMNETNNTQEDVELNRLNGRIVVVPTRAIEYIAIDFIITNSGVAFV